MTPTPPNAGEPKEGLIAPEPVKPYGWVADVYEDGDLTFHEGQQNPWNDSVKALPLYTHPQPNAGVVTELRAEIDRLKNQLLQLATNDGRTVVITGDLVLADDTIITGDIHTHPPECTIVRSEDPTTPDYMAVGTVNPKPIERCDHHGAEE